MRTRIAVALTALAVAALATPTYADAEYTGDGCRIDVTADRTAGGQDAYTGTITIDVVAAPLAHVAVRCDLYQNGTLFAYDVLSASGTGAAFNTGPLQYTADPADVITVCAEVSVDGDTSYDCDDATPIAPPDVIGDLVPTVTSPVVGYVQIAQTGTAPPSYVLAGALADPTLWSCSDNGSAVPYAVTCEPLPNVVLDWRCDVLHADILTMGAAAQARTELDCDGGGPEAATRVAQGIDHDSKLAASAVLVTRFRCTVSDGAGGAAVPSFVAGCGDPGAPTVE